VRPRIATGIDLRQQPEIGILDASPGQKGAPQADQLERVGVDVAGDAVRALREFPDVGGKPGRRDGAVGVRCQNETFGLAVAKGAIADEPGGGQVHRPFAGPAGILSERRQLFFDYAERMRHLGGEGTDDRGCLVLAVIGVHQDLKGALRHRRAGPVALHRQSRQAAFDVVRLIMCGNGDDGGSGNPNQITSDEYVLEHAGKFS